MAAQQGADKITGEEELKKMSCTDFGEFKEALKALRLIDDKIIYKLNVSVPTDSFAGEINAEQKCQELYKELLQGYRSRENAIKGCIMEVSNTIKMLQQQRDKNPDDAQVMKDIRKHQTRLRLMQADLSVEDVIQQRSLKVFNERCWKSFKPPK